MEISKGVLVWDYNLTPKAVLPVVEDQHPLLPMLVAPQDLALVQLLHMVVVDMFVSPLFENDVCKTNQYTNSTVEGQQHPTQQAPGHL